MRTQGLVYSILLLAVFGPASTIHAQFQEPTPDELKMTADPKAPGAAAVYFYREETTDDTLHYHGYYSRMKILTEKGKEEATIHIPYERGSYKVTDIKGRTIHADGTVIPLTAKPTDLMDFKGRNLQINEMVFTLPSAEVGSILEYRLELRYDDGMVVEPTWQIQQPYFVHKAHYRFTPEKTSLSRTITGPHGENLNRLMYVVTGVPLNKVVADPNGKFTVDLEDIPPTPSEEWMPPLNTLNERVAFYYTYASSGAEFWQTEAKRWTKETDRFTNPKDPIRKAVAEIVSPSDSDDQKARKIYAAVMKLNNTDFTRQLSDAERKAQKLRQIKDAEDVWKQQSGSSDEIAMLYVSLARAAGLKVWPMQVVDRDRANPDMTYLNASQLDDYIAIVEIAGAEVYLDPGEKMCPFGQLHWKHTLTAGFRLSDKGPTFSTTPASSFKTAVVKRYANVTFDAQGQATGDARFVISGPDALRWRQQMLENDEDEVRKQFNESIHDDFPDGIQPEFVRFIGLDDPSVDLEALVKISGNIGTATGKRVFLPGFFFEVRSKHPFVAQATRITPIDVHFARMSQDVVTYNFPAGFTVESAPQSSDFSWPQHSYLKIVSQPSANKVTIGRVLAYNYAILEPKEYTGLHDFYQKIASADQQQLVLTRSAPAQGN